ncbi:2-C-methyl-D-erythritol 2,4-cyclodiphosphate synthase [Elusimicrobiota bacterium]
MRTGIGYDIHRLSDDRKMILAGIEIDYEQGLLGYSDADVVIHAICDAILGAASLGDIGRHFPDTDMQYKDISSLKLLDSVREKINQKNYEVNNVDVTIVCEKPKLNPYIEAMEEKLSDVLKIRKNDINVKATTNEGLGSIGESKAVASWAVATIIPTPDYIKHK